MKNINRLLAAAAILLSAAACHTNEIDPVKPDPLNPGESGLSITANIVKTRVTYKDRDEGYLDQQWDEGDILFGYYDGKVTNRVILKVDYLDPEDDYNAILIPVECVGVATLKELADLDKGVNVDLVYTGKNIEDFGDNLEDIVTDLFGSNPDGPLTVDLRSQDGIRIPACMHARAAIVVDEDDENKKSLFFKFVNDCAIIEICSLTGIMDDKGNVLPNGVDLTSLTVSNLVLEGKYSLSTKGFEFGASKIVADSDDVPVVTDYVKNFDPDDDWNVNSDAEIMKGDSRTGYLIAVVPNKYTTCISEDGTDSGITVSVTIGSITGKYPYGEHSFESGMCYVICKEEVVAKTVDGVYFSTVAAAFDHACEISSQHPYDNTVTLVKESIVGLGVSKADEDGNAAIHINYKVTLDLNGCTLSLADVPNVGPECFYVDAYSSEKDGTGEGHLTIKDSRSGGTIESESNYYMIDNYGEVTISDGSFQHDLDWSIVCNNADSDFTVDDGELYSESYFAIDNYSGSVVINKGNISAGYAVINNRGELTINDGTISTETDYHVIQSSDSLAMNGGSVHGKGGSAIYNENGSVTINDGTVFSESSYAVYFLHNNPDADKRSLTIVESGKDNNSYPLIYNNASGQVAIQVVNDTSVGTNFNMRNGLVYSPYGGILLQNNVSGEIFGGQLESTQFCALSLYGGSKIGISGGKVLKTDTSGNISAIRVFCDDDLDSNNTSLTIHWRNNEYGNDKEPLVYSSSLNCACIEAAGSLENYSTVTLSGGFLFSSHNSGDFYNEYHVNSINTCLSESGFGDFFSNQSVLHMPAGNVPLSNGESYNEKVANTLNTAISITATFHKIVKGGDGTYNLVQDQDSTKSLEFKYHITTPSGEDLQNSGTQSYQFSGFNW